MSDESTKQEFLKKGFEGLVADMLTALGKSSARTALTDTTEGSVVRTLVETFGRELALVYEQLERVHRMAYLDTANGQALDLVVALLGVDRQLPGHLEGTVTFCRSRRDTTEILIPIGTRVCGKGVPLCETAEPAVLAATEEAVTVRVRSVEAPRAQDLKKGGALEGGKLPAGKLFFMPRPIVGIESVGNVNELSIPKKQKPESDEELRERARQTVDGANLGTLAALRAMLARFGFTEVKLEEPPGLPGVVQIRVEGLDPNNDNLHKELLAALDRARPAGVQIRLEGTQPLYVGLKATLVLDRERSDQEMLLIRRGIQSKLATYFEGMRIADTVRWSKVNNILGADPAVVNVEHLQLSSQNGAELAEGMDVIAALNQRPALAPTPRAISLTLVPPALLVQLDVTVKTTAAEKVVRVALEKVLAEYEGFRLTADAIKSRLAGALPHDTPLDLALPLRALHRHNGFVVELKNSRDEDVLLEREKLMLGALTVVAPKSNT